MDTLKQRIAALSPAKRRQLEQRVRQSAAQAVSAALPITSVSRDTELPLSFAQQRLWFLDQLQPNSAFYNVPRLLRIRGLLNVDALRNSVVTFVQRHEAIRTTFRAINGKPIQRIAPSLKLDVPVVDLSGKPLLTREHEMFLLLNEESKRPFDLANGPLFRASLLRLAADDHALLMLTHHIISDEWSAGILYDELAILYEAFSKGTSPQLPELPLQYADYAVWQRAWLQGDVLEKELNYWRKQLAGAPEVLNLPFDCPRPTTESFQGAIESRTFSAELRDAVIQVSRRANCTPFVTSLAAFALLLWHYTQQDDFVIGMVLSNRDTLETEKLVGFFLNTLPLRLIVSGDPPFSELLARVRDVATDAYDHQCMPLEKLVEDLRPERSGSKNPLFQVLFTNRIIERPAFEVAGVCMQPLDVPTGTSKFDLSFFVGEGPSGFSVAVEYSTDLFLLETIQRFIEHYRTVLQAAVDHPESRISEFPNLPEQERHQVVVEWNGTERAYPLTCVHQMFEAQVTRTPDAIAITWGGQNLTYSEVNRRANQLAQYLRKRDVGPGALVGICMERSLEMIVGVLGTLKAGAAYVPLDPDYPQERLKFMLEDSAAAVLLTQKHLVEILGSSRKQVLCLDDLDTSHESEENLATEATLGDLVYVIFTSGSTGRPKGVCLPHRALSNLLFWQLENSRAGAGARTLQFTSLSFDVSFQEIFATLCAGGTLVLVGDTLRRDPVQLLRYMREHQINRLFLPFVALQNIAEAAQTEEIPGTLNEVITAGEQLQTTPQLVEFFRRLPNCTLHNQYGPSESHVVTAYTLSGPPETWPALPSIGKPISNSQIYILDERFQKPLPIGASGELYIGGTALATGYLKRPDLTDERFLPNPFALGAKMYRSGDLARFTNDGNIEYLGRADNQVKIRGHRIEPGEIEAVLREHPTVATSAVTVREHSGNKYLVAYVVAKSSEQLAIPLLRDYLKGRLPDYMVPAAFVPMDQLPLTPSGKINRRALPEPDMTQARSSDKVAPRNPVEEVLAGIWALVLNIERVGVHDNFFDLGGHSLLATQVISRITQSLEIKLPLRALFEHPTIANLAEYIQSAGEKEKDRIPPIVPVPREHNLPLSYAQQRLWLLSQIVGSSAAYNAPQILRIRGPLDANLLERSINEIVRRHEVLRTAYMLRGEEPVQIVAANVHIPLVWEDLSSLPEAHREPEALRLVQEDIRVPFDLARGPVLRALLCRLSAEHHILVTTFHHIVVDGWSMAVFDREMAIIYDALAEQQPVPLPQLTIQCADFAAWQRNVMQGELLSGHMEFWREHLAGALPMIDLPTDRLRPQSQSFDGARQYAHLSPELVKELKAFSGRQGATVFMTMFSAMQVLLSQWTGQRDLVVGTIVANRNHVEIENLVGCFMNFLPLRTVISEDNSARDLLNQAKKTVMQAYAHQDCPFEKLIEGINPYRAASGTSLYNVIFLLQNFPAIAFKNRTLEANFIPMGIGATHVDLRFAAGEASDGGMWIVCDYRADLFGKETIQELLNNYCSMVERFVTRVNSPVSAFQLSEGLIAQAARSRRYSQKNRIAIASTFTAEPVEDSIKFWTKELAMPCDVRFTAFNQVFQELFDLRGELARNPGGLNALLIRLEDWWGEKTEDLQDTRKQLERNVEQFILAVRDAAARSSAPYLVCICPAWRSTLTNLELAHVLASAEQRVVDALRDNPTVYVVSSANLLALYPVAEYEDQNAYALGQVPYTQDFFTALGTIIVRRFYRIYTPPHKVLVLDCDNTLWRGVCGEDGPSGVTIDAGCRALQQFVLARRQAGMLLALCSKNNEEDVWKVFEQNPEMMLRREHIASWRINWETKSKNLRALAEELRLGLDSFIFLDDSAIECAEVELGCPEVLALQLPETHAELNAFLANVWAFDHLKTTTEDRQRSEFYASNIERERLKTSSNTLDEFLDSLELEVDVRPMEEAELPRVSQLTQRTNQFNFTTLRRTEAETKKLCGDGAECMVVRVRDRFGDYGLVGAMIFKTAAAFLELESLLLSCRALGRRVEHRMLATLGRVGQQRGIEWVHIRFAPSDRNKPARQFLDSIGAVLEKSDEASLLWRTTTTYLMQVPDLPLAVGWQNSLPADWRLEQT